METIDVGESVPIVTKWWDANGVPVEPATIALTITKPDGTVITKAKSDMAGSPSASGSLVNDVWTLATTATVEGFWRAVAVGELGSEEQTLTYQFLVGPPSAPDGPCEPWCTWDDVGACGSVPEVTAQQQQLWIGQASEILWNFTGRFYGGICEVTRSLCFACWSCRPYACGCEPVNGIDLGGGRLPVWGAWDVVVDGATLDPSAYTVRGRRWLVRLDGGVWPTGSSTNLDPDRFRVSWAFGRRVTDGGRLAAARFAQQIALRCTGSRDCQLPTRVTTIVREGITYTVLDSMKMIAEGRTGLDMVDMWVVSDTKGRKAKPGIFAPAAATGPRRIP